MATRSGRPYRPSQPVQVSIWVLDLENVSQVLQTYLDLKTLLKARTICQAWRQIWGSCVPGLMLDQPQSAAAARSLGRKAVAVFPAVSKACIRLYHSSVEAVLDLTSCDGTAGTAAELPLQTERAAAASAMLRQLQQLKQLRSLHLFTCGNFSNALPQLIPHLPAGQLRVLDLCELPHGSSVLPVIAAHLTHLEKLVIGLSTPWSRADIAALSGLPDLREMTCAVRPATADEDPQCEGFGALTQVTSIKLKLLMNNVYSQSAVVAAHSAVEATIGLLSGMTGLTRLHVSHSNVDHSIEYWHRTFSGKDAYYTGDHGWGRALSGMQRLQHLEVRGYVFYDGFLQAAGQPPLLTTLVMGFSACYEDMDRTSSIGAQAVSHVPHIEVHVYKGMSACCKALTSMPNFKRFSVRYRYPCWSNAQVCACRSCWPPGTHCQGRNGCCGHCKGLQCSCPTPQAPQGPVA